MDNPQFNQTIVTYDGSMCKRLLEESGLALRLEAGLANEAVEWKRSFGRTAKSVHVKAKLVQSAHHFRALQDQTAKLIGHPVLHTFWTDCQDLDVYKSGTVGSVKDEIAKWLQMLKQVWGSASDSWMVIVIENTSQEGMARKSSKLLLQRTSVIDKIKADFAGGKQDKCLTLIDPSRNDSRAAESANRLLHRLRVSILQAYNKQLGRFEEGMRAERERRNEHSWNFCDYFLLQEELAFVYEMLGVYDESLVQYDELDALFTQFVLNSNLSDSPTWLNPFASDLNNWSGVSLRPHGLINKKLRAKMVARKPSLIDVRNYMFSRQSVMLLKLGRPWEVARRCLPFLLNVIQELEILEVPSKPEGSVACWVFLSILEVVTTCEVKSKEAVIRASGEDSTRSLSNAHVQQYCRNTAELWAYCRLKLLALGKLCGLMPKSNPNSEQIHLVVELSSGIDEEELEDANDEEGESDAFGVTSSVMAIKRKQQPVEKLKEALSSKQAFQKCYLELSEYAISTFKHIGRIRNARLVGLDLADFYLDLGQVSTAVTFLADALKTFELDGWNRLRVLTLMKAANCYELLSDHEKLVRTAAQIMCSSGGTSGTSKLITSPQERSLYYQKFTQGLSDSGVCLKLDGGQMLSVKSCAIKSLSEEEDPSCSVKPDHTPRIIPRSPLVLQLDIESYFPATVQADSIKVSVYNSTINSRLPESPPPVTSSHRTTPHQRKVSIVHRSASTRSTASSSVMSSTSTSTLGVNPSGQMLGPSSINTSVSLMSPSSSFEEKKPEDESLWFTNLCSDANDLKNKPNAKAPIHINPGKNRIHLYASAGSDTGLYTLNKLTVVCGGQKLELESCLSSVGFKEKCFQITSEIPTVALRREESPDNPSSSSLWSGIDQKLTMAIYSGSFSFKQGSCLHIRCSSGLVGRQDNGKVDCDTSSPSREFDLIFDQDVKPFSLIELPIILRADICGNLVNREPFTHKLELVEPPWAVNEDQIIALEMPFSNPFFVKHHTSTASKRKFIRFTVYSSNPASSQDNPSQQKQYSQCHDNASPFVLRNHTLSLSEPASKFDVNPLLADNITMSPTFDNGCEYIWELLPKEGSTDESDSSNTSNDLRENINVQFSFDYQRSSTFSAGDQGTFQSAYQLGNLQTLYEVRTRVEPMAGGELLRASAICAFSLTIEQLHQQDSPSLATDFLMYEVLVEDRAEWAVCGRAVGVVDMGHASKQTSVVVEVMALNGGHLLIPRVQIMKYFPASSAGQRQSTTSQIELKDKSGQSHHDAPRSEKFAPGEVYFSTSLSRVHVLPPLYPVTPMATHNQQMSAADNKQRKRLSTGDSRHHEGNSLVLPLTGLSNSPSLTNRNGGTNFHVQNQHISMP